MLSSQFWIYSVHGRQGYRNYNHIFSGLDAQYTEQRVDIQISNAKFLRNFLYANTRVLSSYLVSPGKKIGVFGFPPSFGTPKIWHTTPQEATTWFSKKVQQHRLL